MRRIAWLGAAFAGLAALALVVWSLWPAPARAPVERARAAQYRVRFDEPTVDAALWFVHRYPSYFTSGEDQLGAWLDSLGSHDREFVLAMAQTLMWRWVEHELATITSDDPLEVARAVIGIVRRKTLNQMEIPLDNLGRDGNIQLNSFIGAPHFADGVFARLLRGGNNCEGQNHLAGLLIESKLEPRWPWQPRARAEMIGVWIGNGHDLARIDRADFDQPFYVDAWSNLPPFAVDPSRPSLAPDARAFGNDHPALLPGLRGHAMAEPASYADALGLRVELLPERDAPSVPVDLTIRAPDLSADRLSHYDPWRLFLFARVLHVYDDPRAGELYRFLLDHHCAWPRNQRAYECVAAAAFVKRIGDRGSTSR